MAYNNRQGGFKKKFHNEGGYKKKFNKNSKFKKRPSRGGLSVEVYNNNIEGALKIFKRKVKDSKLMLDLKEKSYFKKPSVKKREKRAIARARNRTNSQN